MKSAFGYIGFFVGMFVGGITGVVPLVLILGIVGAFMGRAYGESLDEEKERERKWAEERERRRRQEEYERERKERRKKEAETLARKYPEATKKFFKDHWGLYKTYISTFDISDDKVEKLLSHSEYEYQRLEEQLNQSYRQEAERKRQEKLRKEREAEEARRRAEIIRRQNLASKFKYFNLGGYKAAYFFDYYPKNRYYSVSSVDESNRRALWNFKDGSFTFGLNALQDFLDGNFTKDEMRNMVLCVIPASTQYKNDCRYRTLCSKIAEKFPITNGYNYITIAYDRNDSREQKSTNTITNLTFSSSVSGKRVILFDDITTRGTSFIQVANQLKARGAVEVYGFFLGKTVP